MPELIDLAAKRRRHNKRKHHYRGAIRQVIPRGPTLRFQYNPPAPPHSGGVGGWDEIERPKDETALEWKGLPARTLALPLFFDGYEDNESIADKIDVLLSFGEPIGDRHGPPKLEFEYGPVGRGHLWIVDTIEWGESLRGDSLDLVRQDVTVTFKQFIGASVGPNPTDRHKHRGKKDDDKKGSKKKKGSTKRHVVVAGESLARISANLYLDSSRWIEIAELNDIRDPGSLVVGQSLQVPDA